MKTYIQSGKDIKRSWKLVDAENITLGKLASTVSKILSGKNKSTYSPYLDDGDYVVVINAEKIHLSGKKWENKIYYHHSGYMGGLKKIVYKDLLKKKPEFIIEKAVKGMLAKNKLGTEQLKHLKVYAGPEHTHQAQNPEKYDIK